MFAKIIAFAAVVAVALGAPKPEPSPQLVYSAPLAPVGLDVLPYSGLPVPSAFAGPLVNPYAAAAYPYGALPYSGAYEYVYKK